MANHELLQGDCELWLNQLPSETVECIFADTPDNIGLSYDAYDDNLPAHEYLKKVSGWLDLFISKAPTVWLSFNAKWTIEMGSICSSLLEDWSAEGLQIKPCVQIFTFGQHRQTDLGNNHRPLWRFQRQGSHLYPDNVRVESERQRMGDKRADPRGRVPSDVFDFTRVVGNDKERRTWHPTQLREGLVERCIKLVTQPGDHVIDPFGGTGTTLRVCKRIDRRCTLIEIDPAYCKEIATEHEMVQCAKGKYSRWKLTQEFK